jgi:hypothetical protein
MTSTIIMMRTTVPIPIYIEFPFLSAPGAPKPPRARDSSLDLAKGKPGALPGAGGTHVRDLGRGNVR